MNKKGSALDLVYTAMILLFFGVVVLIGLHIGGTFNDKLQVMDSSIVDANTKAQTDSTMAKLTYTMDNTYLFLMIFLCIVMLILAAMVAVHPIFIPIYFLTWVFVIFLGGVFSNIYETIAENSELAGTAADLTFINGIMTFLPMLMGVIGIVLMVILYKNSNQ